MEKGVKMDFEKVYDTIRLYLREYMLVRCYFEIGNSIGDKVDRYDL